MQTISKLKQIINYLLLTSIVSIVIVKIYSCTTKIQIQTSIQQNNKVLVVTSNQHTYKGTHLNVSNHFEEIVLAYNEFLDAGFEVDFISPKDGAIPIGYIKHQILFRKSICIILNL